MNSKIVYMTLALIVFLLLFAGFLFFYLNVNQTRVFVDENVYIEEVETALLNKGITRDKISIEITSDPNNILEWSYRGENEKVSGYYIEQDGGYAKITIYIKRDAFSTESEILREINKNYIRAILEDNLKRPIDSVDSLGLPEFVEVYNKVRKSGEFPIKLL